MSSKTITFIAAFACLVASIVAVSARLPTSARQGDFVFAAINGEETVNDHAFAPTPTPVVEPTVEVLPLNADPIEETPEGETGHMPSTSPTVLPPAPEAPSFVPELAYNIGGAKFGKFEADPTHWIVGETSHFEMPEAVIGGAEPQNEDIYKSHRYGLLSSTWGYDIPVTTAGNYQCTLHYAETYSEYFTSEPNRTFRIEISGDADLMPQSEEIDVMVALNGAEFTAYTRTYDIAVETYIIIRESPSLLGDAFLSGITCIYLSPLPEALASTV